MHAMSVPNVKKNKQTRRKIQKTYWDLFVFLTRWMWAPYDENVPSICLFGHPLVMSTRIPCRKAHGPVGEDRSATLEQHAPHRENNGLAHLALSARVSWFWHTRLAEGSASGTPSVWLGFEQRRAEGRTPKRGRYTESVLQAFCPKQYPLPRFLPPSLPPILVAVMEDSVCCSSPHETASLCLLVESTFYRKVSFRLTLLLILRGIYSKHHLINRFIKMQTTALL